MAVRKRTHLVVVLVVAAVAIVALSVWALFGDMAPPDLGDLVLDRRVVPEGENGFELVDFEKGDVVDEDESGYRAGLAFTADWDAPSARALLERNAAALEAVRRALERPELQSPEVRAFDDLVPYLVPWRAVSDLSIDRVALLLEDDEIGEALDQALRTARFGHGVIHAQGPMEGGLIGVTIASRALDAVWRVIAAAMPAAEGLAIDLESAARRLAACSIDASPIEDMIKAEFTCCLSAMDEMPRSLAWMPNETRTRFAEVFREAVRNAQLPAAGREYVGFEERLESFSMMNYVGKVLFGFLPIDFERSLSQFDLLRFQHAATTVLVALARYHRDHHALPRSLGELVPDYLPEVPADPFDGEPIRYSRERRIIWSPGEDLEDSGGSLEQLEERDATGGDDHWPWELDDPTIRVPW